MNRWLAAVLVGLTPTVPIVATAAPIVAAAQPASPQADGPRVAQSETRSKKPRTRVQPELNEEDQLSPRQLDQRGPTRPARPAEEPAQPDPTRPQQSAELPRAIVCNGVFGKESSHLKLATRSDSRLIVINGQSTWTAPKGLRLGLPLAALEKLNGKPFKVSGFDQPNGGSVNDWQGGALEKLPGGCRLGIRLVPDAKATEAARNEVLGTEFMSSDAKMRAVRPIIAEIIIGY